MRLEGGARTLRPVVGGEDHVAIEPGHLLAIVRTEVEGHVQEPLLLP
jgi:hypothetical protein